MSFVSEHEFFSSDSLRLISPHHPHFFSTSSDSFRYLRHAPGLQWQPVRMWMFCLAESVWIS